MNIQVLMSTYNGDLYIEEQLKSIANQNNVNITCIVRDDGSWDTTIEKVKAFCQTDCRFRLYTGEKNVGAAQSFFDLLKNSNDCDYYAFSDQDDIWDTDKLSVAINTLQCEENNIPMMYCSNLRLIDQAGNSLGENYNKKHVNVQKENALVKNISTGCTIVFNKAARNLALKHIPSNNLLHDHWLYLLCVFMGRVIYDETPHISYRQHNGNVIGAENNYFSIWKKRIGKINGSLFNQREMAAKELLNGYNLLLSEEDRKKINVIAEYRSSIKNKLDFLFDKHMKFSTFENNLWLIFQILFGKF